MGDTIVHTFRNKVRMVYSRSNDKITAVSIFIKVGSINEGENQYGISHILEHMLFKGSKKFKTSTEVSWEMDALGAYFNAYTTKDKTCYLATCPTPHFRRMMNILSDIVANPILRKEDFELERLVVLEELRDYDDDPESLIENRIEEMTFEGHQLARPVGGKIEDVRKVTLDEVIRFYRNYYCAENIVVSVCSDMGVGEVKRIVEASEIGRIRQGCDRPNIVRNLNPQSGMRFEYIKKPFEQLYIAVGFRVGSMNGLERFAFDIVESYLAGPLSSRLFIALREENGISYSAKCSYNGYIDMSALVISTSLDKSKLYVNPNGNRKGALQIIIGELNKLVKDGIAKRDLEHTKNYLMGRNMVEIESSLGSSDFDGQVLTLGLNPSVFIRDLGKEYEKIDRELVNRIIRTYIRRDNMSVLVISDMDAAEGRRIKGRVERMVEF